MTSTVYIAKSVYGGEGLGRLGDGRVVFVPGAFAGESVKAEIVTEKRRYVKARLIEVSEASPERIGTGEMPIPGMVYSNLSYPGELAAKEQQLRDFFERARIKVPELKRLTSSENPFNYRNKAVYHFEKHGRDWVFGYLAEPEHKIVEVLEDPLVRPEINAKLPEIRRSVVALLTQGAGAVRRDTERKANLTVRYTARSGVKWWFGDAPTDVILKETTCGKLFEVPAGGFYQVNPEAGDRLVSAVTEEFSRLGGDVIDLYCGVGVFGLSCGAKRVFGVESGNQAVEFARRNAQNLGVNAKFIAGQVVRNLRKVPFNANATVIVDPPRGGMESGVPEALAKSGVARIFYVSCDPATLMRDLAVICKNYEVESVKWVDMFPRTARFETFVSLRKR